MVVCGSAKVSVLGHYAVLSDRDFGDAVKRSVVANPTIVTNYRIPRKCDPNPRSYQNLVTNTGSEEPPSEPPPRIKNLWCRPHKKRIEKPPKLNEPSRPPPELVRRLETRKILKLIPLQIVPISVLLVGEEFQSH